MSHPETKQESELAALKLDIAKLKEEGALRTSEAARYENLQDAAEKRILLVHQTYKHLVWALVVIVTVCCILGVYFLGKDLDSFEKHAELAMETKIESEMRAANLEDRINKKVGEVSDQVITGHIHKQIDPVIAGLKDRTDAIDSRIQSTVSNFQVFTETTDAKLAKIERSSIGLQQLNASIQTTSHLINN